jgi:hypothetical protein
MLVVDPIYMPLIEIIFCLVDILSDVNAQDRVAFAINQAESVLMAQETEKDALEIHTLVSRTPRFLDNNMERRNALRESVTMVLNAKLEDTVEDIPNHGKITHEVAHDRELVTKVSNNDDARLASWVACYDYIRGAFKFVFIPKKRRALPYIGRSFLWTFHQPAFTAVNMV